jgi:tyrosine-protein kinase Etk/Wzc
MSETMNYQIEEDRGHFRRILILAKRMRFILLMTSAFAVFSIVLSLLFTNVYEGTARILPNQQSDTSLSGMLMSQVTSAVGGLAGGLAGGLGPGTPSDLDADILGSRTIADAMIDRFDLMALYDVKRRDDARRVLGENLQVKISKKSGIITIQVRDEDPKRAADMANAFVEELTKLHIHLGILDAYQRRHFFEEQLEQARGDLIAAEEALRQFAETTGAIKIDSQTGAVFEGIGSLRAQLAAKEIQLKVMRMYATPNNREIKQLEEEVSGIKEQLKILEEKGSGSEATSVIPVGKIPALSTEYLRKLREFKYQEMLFEQLAKLYATAKFDEVKNLATLNVIDSATPPQRKVRPKRALIVLFTTMGGFCLAVFLAFFAERWEKILQNPENRERWARILEYLSPIIHSRAMVLVRGSFDGCRKLLAKSWAMLRRDPGSRGG